MSRLRALRDAIGMKLVQIEDLLPTREYRLTLIVRHRSNPNGHILLTVDSMDDVRRALVELEAPTATVIPGERV